MSKKKNILWVFGDQHRRQALSCHGDPNAFTPNLDNFSNYALDDIGARSGFPLCCPFRGALLTGVYPHKCVPGHEERLDPKQDTVAHVFNTHGYDTAYFGKWHLDGHKEGKSRAAFHIVPPEARGGFKTWVGYENNNSQWDCWVHGGEGENAFLKQLDGFETDALTDYLLDYIKSKAQPETSEPFFAVLSVQPPHDPYTAPAEFRSRYNPAQLILPDNVPNIPYIQEQARRELAGYYALIENLDWNFGRILKTLKELGLDENTEIMFFSDHGDQHGSHGQFRKMTPYEEAVGIPMMIGGQQSRYGRRIGRVNLMMNHVDIAPTSLGLCDIKVPEWMQGTDYSGATQNGDKNEYPDSQFLQSVIPTCHGNSVDQAWRGVVTRDGWKYIAFENQPYMLFNLNEDPQEMVNLAHNSSYWQKRDELNKRTARWIEETGDSFSLPK